MKAMWISSMGIAMVASIAWGDVVSTGEFGINSRGLALTGEGIAIGQVETTRPGKSDYDTDPLKKNTFITPAGVYLRNGMVGQNQFIDTPSDGTEADKNHSTYVASVMISTNEPVTRGVAPMAELHASALNSVEQSISALTLQHVATRNGGDVRAINMSYVHSRQFGEPVDGNSLVTLFVDWSASVHDTLYVVGGQQDDANFPFPTDNFNGMTIVASMQIADAGKWRQVASSSVVTDNAARNDLMAPGGGLFLAGMNNSVVMQDAAGTSFAAPHVTGTVALLQQYAEQQIDDTVPRWNANARRHEVMKAVLLNSADKIEDNGSQAPVGKLMGMERTVIDTMGNDWLSSEAYTDDTISLDDEMGAGHLNAKRALRQFNSGEYDTSDSLLRAGWDYGTTDGFEDIQKYSIGQALVDEEFVSLTLCWDREVFFEVDDDADGAYDVGDTFLTDPFMTDLNLYLMPAGATDIGDAVARSISESDSVEHIFYQLDQAQQFANYEIWVEQASGSEFSTQNYALAWWAGSVAMGADFGDYDGNGTVEPADYVVWKSNFGTANAAVDGNGNGIVDAADYTVWRDHLGEAVGAGSGSLASVPEPTAALLLLAGLVGFVARRRLIPTLSSQPKQQPECDH